MVETPLTQYAPVHVDMYRTGGRSEIVAFEECAHICRDGGGSGSEWSSVFRRLAQRQGSRYLNFATFRHLVITFTKQPTFATCAWTRDSPYFTRVSPLRFRLDFTAVHPLRIVELFTTEAMHVLAHYRQNQSAPKPSAHTVRAAETRADPSVDPPCPWEAVEAFGARARLPADEALIRHRALRLSFLLQREGCVPAVELDADADMMADADADADADGDGDADADAEGDDNDSDAEMGPVPHAAPPQSSFSPWKHRWRTWIMRMRAPHM